uniref:Orf215 n=1 Tax=Monoblepharella sp. JEL15 TaxID=224130 RepID=Q85MB9_9FUNG|nr:orf215 [Monoblepharella sp. JEL15]AAO64963.1 orf215 [Monoblepharella sp. JEL15]
MDVYPRFIFDYLNPSGFDSRGFIGGSWILLEEIRKGSFYLANQFLNLAFNPEVLTKPLGSYYKFAWLDTAIQFAYMGYIYEFYMHHKLNFSFTCRDEFSEFIVNTTYTYSIPQLPFIFEFCLPQENFISLDNNWVYPDKLKFALSNFMNNCNEICKLYDPIFTRCETTLSGSPVQNYRDLIQAIKANGDNLLLKSYLESHGFAYWDTQVPPPLRR